MASRMNRRKILAGVCAVAAAPLVGGASAVPVTLTPDHAGRHMITRNGERVGPVEYDAAGFGLPDEKQWRAPIGYVRAYYWADGRISHEEERSDDIVAEA